MSIASFANLCYIEGATETEPGRLFFTTKYRCAYKRRYQDASRLFLSQDTASPLVTALVR